jgi:MFS family permease
MDLVALGWLALQFTGSPFMVGVAAFARAAPLMVVGPFTGIVADRVPRGRILLVAPAVGMATALALTAIFWSGRGGYGALVALEIVFGLVWALDFPARRTALYTLLGAGRVGQAVSLETVSMQIAKMLGPLAAGLCLAQAGPAAGFAVMALVYGGGLAASSRLRGRLGGPGTATSHSVATSRRTGLELAWRTPTVRTVLLVTVAMNSLGRALGLALAARVRDAARRDRRRRIRLRHDAEYARAPGGTRACPGRRHGYPVGVYRHSAARHPGDRPAGGKHRGAAGVRGERARLAPRHRPPRRASRGEGESPVTSTNP